MIDENYVWWVPENQLFRTAEEAKLATGKDNSVMVIAFSKHMKLFVLNDDLRKKNDDLKKELQELKSWL